MRSDVNALDFVERDLVPQAIVELGGAGGLVPGDPGRDLEGAAVSKVLRDPGAVEAVGGNLGGYPYIYKRAKDKAQIRKAGGRGMQAWHRKPVRCSPNMRAFTQPSTSAQTAAALLCLAAPIANDWPDIRSRHEKGNAP